MVSVCWSLISSLQLGYKLCRAWSHTLPTFPSSESPFIPMAYTTCQPAPFYWAPNSYISPVAKTGYFPCALEPRLNSTVSYLLSSSSSYRPSLSSWCHLPSSHLSRDSMNHIFLFLTSVSFASWLFFSGMCPPFCSTVVALVLLLLFPNLDHSPGQQALWWA